MCGHGRDRPRSIDSLTAAVVFVVRMKAQGCCVVAELVGVEIRIPPILDGLEIESVAERLATLSAKVQDALPRPSPHPIRDLAASLGHRVNITRKVPEPFLGLVHPQTGVIHVKPFRDVRTEDVLVSHELLHPVLGAEHPHHSHSDVWHAALATLAPRGMLRALARTGRLSPAEIAVEAGMPWWAAALRLDAWMEREGAGLLGSADERAA